MAHDTNTEILNIVLSLQETSQEVIEWIDKAVSYADDNGMFTMPVEAATAIKTLIAVQNKALARTIEHEQQIFDAIEKFASTHTPE